MEKLVKENSVRLLMLEILEENKGMDAQLLLNEVEKRMPEFLKKFGIELCYCKCHSEPAAHRKGMPHEHCVSCRKKEFGYDYEKATAFGS